MKSMIIERLIEIENKAQRTTQKSEQYAQVLNEKKEKECKEIETNCREHYENAIAEFKIKIELNEKHETSKIHHELMKRQAAIQQDIDENQESWTDTIYQRIIRL